MSTPQNSSLVKHYAPSGLSVGSTKADCRYAKNRAMATGCGYGTNVEAVEKNEVLDPSQVAKTLGEGRNLVI
ncbi:hypothetical protein TWF730_006160 [Orbilia blumenaviensis]|uniref:Uncharacterized protein n=1 Tax=Orbilia blumenaviensis TaxID=1796055 RepID=A0AAV9TW56_9PEZI